MNDAQLMENPGIGDNLPPPADARLDELQARTNTLVETAKKWANEREVLANDDEATKAKDFKDQLRKQWQAVDEERKAVKAPHSLAATAVDTRYNPLKRPIEIAAEIIGKKLTAWLNKLDAIKEQERIKAEQASRAAEEAARKAAAEAEAATGGAAIDKQIAAEEARARAAQAARDARQAAERPKVASAYGGRSSSLRTYVVVAIEDAAKIPAKHLRLLCARSYVTEALERAVKENPAAFKDVPGIKITEEKRAV